MPRTFGERPSWQRKSCAGRIFWLIYDGSVLLGALPATGDRQHTLARGKTLFSQLGSHDDRLARLLGRELNMLGRGWNWRGLSLGGALLRSIFGIGRIMVCVIV